MTDKDQQDASTVFAYHERSKHHLHRYARSLGYMDWANQPNPFRFYEGSKRIRLPLIEKDTKRSYTELYKRPKAAESVRLVSVAAFLELSLALSAWKKYGSSQWSLRMNPSSGNLHPTEGYLILPAIDGHPAALVHYSPLLHCLEVRSNLDEASAGALSSAGGFGVILTSIYWREAWKYGERAFRYCNHDVGHAFAALGFSANLQGWSSVLVPSVSNRALDEALGLNGVSWPESEEEHSDCLSWIGGPAPSQTDLQQLLQGCKSSHFEGVPNQLSENHNPWDIIETASRATRSPGSKAPSVPTQPTSWAHSADSSLTAPEIIRRRRSALGYDFQKSRTDRETFLAMMERVLAAGFAPFDGFPFEPRVHLALFVHNVTGVESGLYLLVRNPNHKDELQSLLTSDFSWEPVEKGLPLYLLKTGEFREQATMISCHQDIAGASAFSMGMLARFRPLIEEAPWDYPRLFWETGMVGQVLYLEAEAHGLRATGIGCFFDDEMHRLLGLADHTYQSLYHFTVGYPIEDSRLQTLEPYHHLNAG